MNPEEELVDEFFDPVFNAEDEKSLREFLQTKPHERLKLFYNFWNWANSPFAETVFEHRRALTSLLRKLLRNAY